MEHKHLLGSSFDCDCGKKHRVPTQFFHYGENAFDFLIETARSVCNGQKCLILADIRTYDVAGKRVEELLKNGFSEVYHYIVPDVHNESPATDDVTKDLILETSPSVDLYIGVGSGVISNLAKWVAFLCDKPYIIILTAASMNGYASANVAATIGGLKMLFHASACQAVFVDPKIIMNAPYELTVAGLGDVLAKSVSSADWKLNNFLFNEYHCQFAVDLLKDLEPVYLENPNDIKNKQQKAFKALFEALLYSSIAMTITGTSSPASGGEHLISHTLDMMAARDGRKHDLHGRQVGVASILMAALYEKVMDIEKPLFRKIPQKIDKQFWGSLAPIVEKEYEKKLDKFEQAAAFLSKPGNWNRLKDLIKPNLVPAEKLKNCLVQAGGAHRYTDIRANDLTLARDEFIAVVKNANQMRQRFTILDMGLLLGIIPDEIDRLIDQWVTR